MDKATWHDQSGQQKKHWIKIWPWNNLVCQYLINRINNPLHFKNNFIIPIYTFFLQHGKICWYQRFKYGKPGTHTCFSESMPDFKALAHFIGESFFTILAGASKFLQKLLDLEIDTD